MRWLGLALLAGCFNPTYPEALMCGPLGECPPGQECDSASNTCKPIEGGAADGAVIDGEPGPDAVMADAGPDAPPGFADARPSDARPIDAMPTECNDGADNDNDGTTDFGGDPGCDSASDTSEKGSIQCDDNSDNDGDGTIDFRLDGAGDDQCASPSEVSENDPPMLFVQPLFTTPAGPIWSYTPGASDPDGHALTWSATWPGTTMKDPFDPQVGASFDPSTHTLTIPAGVLGDFDVDFTVTDNRSLPVTARTRLTVTASQVMLNEVFVGNEEIELINVGTAFINIGSYRVATRDFFFTLPPLMGIPPGGIFVIHWNQNGSSDANNYYTGCCYQGLGTADDTIMLLRPEPPPSSMQGNLNTVEAFEILDYMQWDPNVWENDAEFAGQWQAGFPDPPNPSCCESLSRFRGMNTESGNDWYRDTTSGNTIGAPNSQ